MDHLPDFKYEPLDSKTDSIRLLQLKGVDDLGRPVVRLFHTTISAARYYAVSYMWGSSTKQYPIILNDQQLLIGQNLYDFLVQLLSAAKEPHSAGDQDESHLIPNVVSLRGSQAVVEPLELHSSADYALGWRHNIDGHWIDAICLNQNDVLERNHQVSQMYDIYKQAKCVLTWLGHQNASVQDSLLEFRQHQPSELHDGLRQLLRLPYWRRAWILQELHAANDVFLIVGNLVVGWEPLWSWLYIPEVMRHWPGIKHELAHYHFQFRKDDQSNARSGRASGHKKLSLSELMLAVGQLGCADPRDHIYSVRSILSEGRKFRVDYEENSAELATRAAFYFDLEPWHLERVLRILGVSDSDWRRLPHGDGEDSGPISLTARSIWPQREPLRLLRGGKLAKCPHCGASRDNIWTVLPVSTLVLCGPSFDRKLYSSHIFTLRTVTGWLRFGPVTFWNDGDVCQWINIYLPQEYRNASSHRAPRRQGAVAIEPRPEPVPERRYIPLKLHGNTQFHRFGSSECIKAFSEEIAISLRSCLNSIYHFLPGFLLFGFLILLFYIRMAGLSA